MSTKLILAAAPADVTIGLALDPPVRGCHGGSGFHVFIPPDWFVRCNAGEQLAGCNFSHLEDDGSLYVSDTAQSRTANPVYTTGLNAGQLSAFVTKLATASTGPGGVVISAMAELP